MRNIFFLALMLLGAMHVSAGEAELAIIIDLDLSETKDSENIPLTQSLALAILSERCPIITSRSLVEALHARQERFLSTESKDKPADVSLYDWAKKLDIPQEKVDLLCSLVDLKNPFWSVYADIDSPLVYIIPAPYASSNGIQLPGTKVDSLEKLFAEASPAKPEGKGIALKIISFFSPLYSTKQSDSEEYAALPYWDIFMNGHGTAGLKIAGMPTESFNTLISFFNRSLKTRFLFYISCYSGGTNLENLLKTVLINDSNRFTLATNVLADTTTQSSYFIFGCTDCWEPKNIRVPFAIERKYTLNFLFDSINAWFAPYEKGKTYPSLRDILENFTQSTNIAREKNFIQIKPPYAPWLSETEKNSKGLFIDSGLIQAAQRADTAAIEIDSHVQYVVLGTPTIPVPLITADTIPDFYLGSIQTNPIYKEENLEPTPKEKPENILFKGYVYVLEELVITSNDTIEIEDITKKLAHLLTMGYSGKSIIFIKKVSQAKDKETVSVIENVLLRLYRDGLGSISYTAEPDSPVSFSIEYNTGLKYFRIKKVESYDFDANQYKKFVEKLLARLDDAQKNYVDYEKILSPVLEKKLLIELQNELAVLSESLHELSAKLS